MLIKHTRLEWFSPLWLIYAHPNQFLQESAISGNLVPPRNCLYGKTRHVAFNKTCNSLTAELCHYLVEDDRARRYRPYIMHFDVHFRLTLLLRMSWSWRVKQGLCPTLVYHPRLHAQDSKIITELNYVDVITVVDG